MKGRWLAPLVGALIFSIILFCALYFTPLPRPMYRAYVLDHEDYFFDRPGYFERTGRSSFLSQLPFFFMDWKFKSDWRRHIQTHPALPDGSIAQIESILDRVKPLFLTQNEVHHEPLATSGLATLVRGYGYCDQINMSLALALQGIVPQSEVWALYDRQTGISPHTAVRVSGTFGTLYADLWQPQRLFGFEEEVTHTAKNRVPLFGQIAPELEVLFQRSGPKVRALYQQGEVLNRHDLLFQLSKLAQRYRSGPLDVPQGETTLRRTQSPGLMNVQAPTHWPNPVLHAIPDQNTHHPPQSIRHTYLNARFALIWGERPSALDGFSQTVSLCEQRPAPAQSLEQECAAARLFIQANQK